jgi:hypothetical protein
MFVTYVYLETTVRVRLEEIIAKLDRTDPHWRLDDLDKDVPPLPDKANNILIIQQIIKEKPANWPAATAQEQISGVAPQRQFDSAQALLLKKEMDRAPAITALVRKLAEVTRGHVKINWTPDVVGTAFPLLMETREVAEIAKWDALLRIQEQNYDGALESCRAMLSAGRANDRGFALLQMLIRQAIQSACIDIVERTLAQGEPSETALRAMQNLLEDELAQPLLVTAFRGERAASFGSIDFLARNKGLPLRASIRIAWETETDPFRRISAVVHAPFNNSAEANQAMILQCVTDVIEALQQPEPEQSQAFERVDALAKDVRQPPIFRLLLPALSKLREANLRSQARLRSAVTALAAERYRRQHGAWPEKLDALVPTELKQAGVDPFNGEPLIFRRLPDGLVIYSVGQNRIDDGGLLSASKNGSPADIGFRLWDVSLRRPKPADTPGKDAEK